jgi:hypothetical protein
MIFKNKEIPSESIDPSRISSRINKFVLTEFFIAATDIRAKVRARLILCF